MKLVIFLCMVSWGFANGFYFPTEVIGELDQSEPYLFVGEYLNVTCTLTSQTVENGDNSSKLFFSYGWTDIEVLETETTIITNASLKYSTLMTTVFMRKYSCNLRNPVSVDPFPGSNFATVDTVYVDTEYHPEPVTNFSCIIYDWDEKMECSWDLGVNYRELRYIDTSLYLQLTGSCPNKNLLKCKWIRGESYSFDRSSLTFIVSVKNTKRNVSVDTDWITIIQAEYVKPNPIEEIEIVYISSRCVSLKWNHKKSDREKKFIIHITSKWTDDKVIKSRELNTTVCELKPNTEYKISTVVRPEYTDYGNNIDIGNSSDIGFPSNAVVIIATTQTDLPDRPPDVSPGSYVVSVEGCRNNNRNVTLYWKDLPETYQNGQMLGYIITVSSEDGKLSTNPIISRTFTSLLLPCRQEVLVSFFSRNEVGDSLEPSNIYIPIANTILPLSRIIVEAQNTSKDTTVSVSWTPTEDERITFHTVYYCQFDTQCTTDIEWIRVPMNSTLLTIEHLEFDKKYRFGVSSDIDQVSSGFEWEDCYYLTGLAPSPPTQVDVVAFPEDGITVDWSDPKCGDSPYIEFFKVTWCTASKGTTDCSGVEEGMEIPSTEPTKLVIPNLKAGTSYGVQIQQITGDGRISDYSDMVLPYSSQLSKDSGRSSLASDGLQSPAVDNKLDVFPLPEETTGVNSNQKSSDDHKTSSKQDCSPGYSKMALETDTASSKQENTFKNITDPPIVSASHEDERRKSEKTLNPKHNENENTDSYIKHVEKESNVTANIMLESGSVSDPYVYQPEVQMSKTCGQQIKDQPYIKTETLEATDNSRNYGIDSTKNCKVHDGLLPLTEVNDEDSDISMISNGYLPKDAVNNLGISLPRHQPSAHNSDSSTVEYHHLDSMENLKLLEVFNPLMTAASAKKYQSDDLKEKLGEQDFITHNTEPDQEDSISNGYLKEEDIMNPGVMNSLRERDQAELNSAGYLRDIDVGILNREPAKEDLKGTNYISENMNDWTGKSESSGGYFTERNLLNGNLIDDENVSSYVSDSNDTRKVENSFGSGYITENYLLDSEFSGNDQGSTCSHSGDSRVGQINSSAEDSFQVTNKESKPNDGYIQHNDIKT
ncbi:cytokine receptor domeless [Mytilus galloprovincialis]|uniref:Cytokine receptor domeless n=1 Tax=Mytilus galloprovincialis TaxID=29158 RepID=A0A8B6FM37_MYTGA|nr:cytokine receptor domeless [Mytilus galloprovincialis]